MELIDTRPRAAGALFPCRETHGAGGGLQNAPGEEKPLFPLAVAVAAPGQPFGDQVPRLLRRHARV